MSTPPSADLSEWRDDQLHELIQSGSESGMAALYDRYSRLVYSVALRVLRDPAAAEDVLQEVFMSVWRKPERLEANRGTAGAWLAVVARNRAIDLLRRRKHNESVDDVVLASDNNLAADLEQRSVLEKVRSAVNALPAPQRRAVEMAFFDGLTHVEIAASTGDPLGTVKTRIRTALLVLRRAVQA